MFFLYIDCVLKYTTTNRRESNEHYSRADHKHSDRHVGSRPRPLRASASPSRYSGVGTFRGTFDDFDAKLVDGRLEGIAKVASVQVDDENLAGHLQTPDFFDAEQFPELRFASKHDRARRRRRLDPGRPDASRRHAAGRDRGHGHRARSRTRYGQQRIGFDLETTVNRHDFGINWNMELPGGGQALGDDVVITANLALVQA